MTDVLTSSVYHLRALYPTFVHYYLADEEAVPSTSEDDVIDLAQLVCPILDFVSASSRQAKSKEWLVSNLQDLVLATLNYAQITHDDVRCGLFFRSTLVVFLIGRVGRNLGE